MKKLMMAVLCSLQFTVFAQPVIKAISMPKLAVDSSTRLRTLKIERAIPGAKKDKLAVLLGKWVASNYTLVKNSNTTGDTTIAVINGEDFFSGSCPINHLQRDPNATDRVSTNQAPIDYKISFNIKVVVTDAKYLIMVDHLKLQYLNVITAVEPFYNESFPNVLMPPEDRGLDVGEMYNYIFNDINLHLQDVGKSASRYIAKAQKKGDL